MRAQAVDPSIRRPHYCPEQLLSCMPLETERPYSTCVTLSGGRVIMAMSQEAVQTHT